MWRKKDVKSTLIPGSMGNGLGPAPGDHLHWPLRLSTPVTLVH